MNLGIFRNQLSRHKRDISRTRHMSLRIQTIAVHKVRIIHPQPFGSLIHLPDKLFLTSAYVFSHCYAGIICTRHCNAFKHRVHCLSLSRLQKYLRSSHRRRIFRCCHLIFQMDTSRLQCIKNKQHGHYFRHACRRAWSIRIFFINHCARGSFHKHGRRSTDSNFRLL